MTKKFYLAIFIALLTSPLILFGFIIRMSYLAMDHGFYIADEFNKWFRK